MKTIILLLMMYALTNSFPASAQQEHHGVSAQKAPSSKSKKKSAAKKNLKGMGKNTSKKDTIKAMNDPMMDLDDETKNDAKDSMKMNGHDIMSIDTTKSGKHNDHVK